jgi:hypothetical protein
MWMYLLSRANNKMEPMCARVIDVDSTVYATFRLSCLRGWSRRRVPVFLFLTVVTRGTHQS